MKGENAMRNRRFIKGMIIECGGFDLETETFVNRDRVHSQVQGRGLYLVINNNRGTLEMLHICNSCNLACTNCPNRLIGNNNI